MRLRYISITALLGCTSATFGQHDALAAQGMLNLEAHIATNGYPEPQACSLEKSRVRKEWSRLSRSEKLNYIDALKCLAKTPAKTPSAIAAGAKSRYDDFVVTHILQSLTNHGTANFLSWHRYYLLAFENTLRDECGYTGYQPYYNWAWWAEDPKASPLFDGSDTSISGDGTYIPGRNASCVPNPQRCLSQIPPAQGGGCVTSGPLKDWTVNLGPIQSLSNFAPPNPQPDGLGLNQRCLSRDLNPYAANYTTDAHIVSLITKSPDILTFQDRMQSPGPETGVHLGGHYTIGGDAGSDFFNSPSDPAFWFHHAMIDRVWWIWQNQDLIKRERAIAGTMTFLNQPPSREGRLDDVLELGYVGLPNLTVNDAMSTVGGPFCYVYET
ncbi:hypothetical protein DE146DRAFT_677855 [Phaeosphaeria sp. MPI-PUGE-AT-0046c]|nr:hypothetical protein DE146DRAFT_677855 [Phaeosphaeria sp. MPI-PUGE-AT-0046c]